MHVEGVCDNSQRLHGFPPVHLTFDFRHCTQDVFSLGGTDSDSILGTGAPLRNVRAGDWVGR